MLQEGLQIPPKDLDCQVVIVGSGAAGAVLAKELALGGVDVVLLEAGMYHTVEELSQREEQMLPSLYDEQGGRTTTDLSVTIVHGRSVGGGTTHNLGLCMPPEKAILERWAQECGVEGLSQADLKPSVERVWRSLGVNQLLDTDLNLNNQMLKQGADKLGWHGFIPFNNRISCLRTGFCELGCAYNRKQSMAITYVPGALAAGARVLASCRAERILVERGEAVGVEARVLDRSSRRPLHAITVRARTVILSAGAIHSPVLLMKSGLGQGSPLLGKRLHLHPSAAVGAVFEKRLEAWRGIPQSYLVDEFAEFYRKGRGGYIIIPVFAHPGSTAVMTPGLGADHARIMGRYAYLAGAVPMVHDETHGQLAVKADGRIDVRYWPEGEDVKTFQHGIRKVAELFFAAGAKEVMLPYTPLAVARSLKDLEVIEQRGIVPHGVGITSVHPQSSVPMGGSPATGVVDSHCETFEVKRLFVCDTSAFPTSLGTPPTIPTASLATHVARYLLRERARYTG